MMPICETEVHCSACRHAPNVEFRRQLLEMAGRTDLDPKFFPCPKGHPFGPMVVLRVLRSPEQQAMIVENFCDDCPQQKLLENDVPSCKLLVACGCATGASCRKMFLGALLNGKCPEGKW